MRKVCSKCGIEKDVGEFHKNRSKPGGLSRQCKECVCSRMRARYADNPCVFREKSAAWNNNNPQKAASRRRKTYVSNRNTEIARSKAQNVVRSGGLTDDYVSQVLKQQGLLNPTPETINTKRTQLKIIRKIKEIEKFNKQKESK